ncbi:hypothetical protein FOL47_001915 [Perkinsus chesapeaki]|uniref:Uncharacterized protein n=1 Tax=Perkinsus chesapeaki TaxID=330153 RepID=A0A7J6KRA9_PERCH|nr:hypothetical protein FOL47_001915 [Perkinsus chesapeaki]
MATMKNMFGSLQQFAGPTGFVAKEPLRFYRKMELSVRGYLSQKRLLPGIGDAVGVSAFLVPRGSMAPREGINSEPGVRIHDLNPAEDRRMILASDGVFDGQTDEQCFCCGVTDNQTSSTSL